MANLAAAAKILIALVTDEKARKRLGWLLTVLLAPVIVTAALLCSLAAGAAEHNVSAVRLCIESGTVPAELPAEYRAHIEEMQGSFALLDSAVEEINGLTEDGKSLDAARVKAIFYALFFGEKAPSLRDHRWLCRWKIWRRSTKTSARHWVWTSPRTSRLTRRASTSWPSTAM